MKRYWFVFVIFTLFFLNCENNINGTLCKCLIFHTSTGEGCRLIEITNNGTVTIRKGYLPHRIDSLMHNGISINPNNEILLEKIKATYIGHLEDSELEQIKSIVSKLKNVKAQNEFAENVYWDALGVYFFLNGQEYGMETGECLNPDFKTLTEFIIEKQRTISGNYPWDYDPEIYVEYVADDKCLDADTCTLSNGGELLN